MNFNNNIDLTAIITTTGFIVAMVVWGIRLEGEVSAVASSIETKEIMYEKMTELRWASLESQLNTLRMNLYKVEQQQRENTP